MKLAQQDNSLKLFIKEHHIDTFDPVKCVSSGFCDTFNFNYSREQFLQLIGIAELNIKANVNLIRNFLREQILEIREKLLYLVVVSDKDHLFYGQSS